jgi:hypothetical protein
MEYPRFEKQTQIYIYIYIYYPGYWIIISTRVRNSQITGPEPTTGAPPAPDPPRPPHPYHIAFFSFYNFEIVGMSRGNAGFTQLAAPYAAGAQLAATSPHEPSFAAAEGPPSAVSLPIPHPLSSPSLLATTAVLKP